MWPLSRWPRSLRGRHGEGVGGWASGGRQGLTSPCPLPPHGGGLGLDNGFSRGTGTLVLAAGPPRHLFPRVSFHRRPCALAHGLPPRCVTPRLLAADVLALAGVSAAAAFLGSGVCWDIQPLLRPEAENSLCCWPGLGSSLISRNCGLSAWARSRPAPGAPSAWSAVHYGQLGLKCIALGAAREWTVRPGPRCSLRHLIGVHIYVLAGLLDGVNFPEIKCCHELTHLYHGLTPERMSPGHKPSRILKIRVFYVTGLRTMKLYCVFGNERT